MPEPHILLSGLVVGEAPRWRANRLWCTDQGADEVLTVDLAGRTEVIARIPSWGIGFLPNGCLLIVSLRDGLLRREPNGTLATHAGLTRLSSWLWNDLVVDGRGNAYVANIGFDFSGGFRSHRHQRAGHS